MIDKATFVKTKLEPAIVAATEKQVKSLEYKKLPSNEELVVITFSNGYQKSCVVTCDSCLSMCADVSRFLY